MEQKIKERKQFNNEEIDIIAPMEKFAVLAAVSPEGNPHIALINSIMAQSSDKMTIGEFTTGQIKNYMELNKKVSFCIQTGGDMIMFRGRALWTHKEEEGDELEAYKNTPIHRYNAYFPIHTVHYLDLVSLSIPVKLSVVATVVSTMMTKLAKGATRQKGNKTILSYFSQKIINTVGGLKYLSYVDEDGFPVIIPILQCQTVDSGRLTFTAGQFGNDLKSVASGTNVAVYASNMSFESVLVRGKFHGMKRFGVISLGTVDIEWVYNSMPPNTGQIYPAVELKKVDNY